MERTIASVGREQVAPQEARLWQAVIAHTIQEWVSGPMRRQREAEQFLFSDNKDFKLVCEAAGMNAESLRKKLEKIRKQTEVQIACRMAA